MDETIRLQTPVSETTAEGLRAGQRVLLSGVLFTARDAAHQRLCDLIEQGCDLPMDIKDQIIYFVGPTPAGAGRVIGAAGPTTSSRMDRFSPLLYAHGLRGTIGKGYRGAEVSDALRKYHAVHFSALGGAGALLSECITAVEVVAYEDLGTEAIRKLTVCDFPATVAYDCHGNSVYEKVASG